MEIYNRVVCGEYFLKGRLLTGDDKEYHISV